MHMTGDKNIFSSFTPKRGGSVSYNDSTKGRIMGSSTVGKNHNPTIENVLLVKGLKHNLLSIIKLCNKDNKVMFDSSIGRIIKSEK